MKAKVTQHALRNFLSLTRAKKNDLFFFSKFLEKIIGNFCPQLRASRKIFLSFRPQGAGEMGLTRKICGRKVILACGLRAKTHFGLRVAGDPSPKFGGGGLGGFVHVWSERLLVMFPNAISEVISELKSVREPSERISDGPKTEPMPAIDLHDKTDFKRKSIS